MGIRMQRWLWPSVALALVIAYPLLFSSPFQQRLGALVLLYAIAASAWNIVGGYAGQVSVGHVVFFGCGAYAAMGAYAHFALSPLVGIPVGIVAFVTVSLGGFGSVPGALVAGLLIGVIESVSGYLIGAVYKDIVVYVLFLFFLWFRPQGLMGKT